MSNKLVARAFLEIEVDPETWLLPKEYARALEPYMASSPTSFFLPWPSELVPEPGRIVSLHGICAGWDTFLVDAVDYSHLARDGFWAIIRTSGRDNRLPLDLNVLLDVSDEGFYPESRVKSIKEILDKAGLPSTRKT